MNNKLLVVVSDLHCGSTVGLMHPDAETSDGNTIGFGKNYHQQWLWEKWTEAGKLVEGIAGNDPYVLLVNGDATEGIHHKSPEVVAQLIDDHCRIAAKCLGDLAGEASAVLVTKGTECHTHNIENYLAKLIGAKGGTARDQWNFRIHGCRINAAHHMPTSARAYLEASAMSIVLGNARLNCLRAGQEPAKVFLRAHRHCGGWYSDGSAMIASTGGWQFLTRFGHKAVTDSVPRPSVLVLDWRGCDEGSLPRIHDLTFNPPAPEITDL